MKRWTSPGFAARVVLAGALLPAYAGLHAQGQDGGSSKLGVFLGRARTSEQRGRLDLAAHDWLQVLLADPNNAEALAGLVRAARAGGRTTEAEYYLSRLRVSHPKAPALAVLEGSGTERGEAGDHAAELAEAARLARAGDSRGATLIYRRVYGLKPPPGPEALAYYEAEAGTEEGRPHALAGLRALADLYPAEARYSVALGRALLGNPRTRGEGRALLERYPGVPEAVTALRENAGKTGGTAGSGAEIVSRQLGSQGPDAARSAPVTVAKDEGRRVHTAAPRLAGASGVAATDGGASRSGAGRHGGFAAEEEAAFRALDAHRAAEAEERFRAILARDPANPRALAGMGYLSLLSDDFKGALRYFVQAQGNGDHSLALTRALVNTQFASALGEADAARQKGDLAEAEARYRSALRERPADPEALEGLGATLLQAGRTAQAVLVYTKLTEVRPLSPAAWRGLVIAQSGAGQSGGALAAEAHEPDAVREPLSHDPIYLEALAKAREAFGGTALAQAQRAQEATSAQGAVPLPSQRPSPPKAVAVPPAAVPAPAQTATVAAGGDPAEKGRFALGRGENARAVGLFREAIAQGPGRADAWRGLVLALYASGREAEAVSAADEAPVTVRAQLGSDATFEAAVGAVYLKAGRPSEALHAFARAQNVFVAQKLPPPVGLLLGIAALLAARDDDGNLYRELLYLGSRADLSEAQRRAVQQIWAGWAVRRARALAGAGEQTRAVVLLNATAQAFPGNAEVVYAVADGYAGVGLPREATALYKAQDLSRSSLQEVERVIRAGMAAHDWKAAEGWLRMGRERFPQEPMMYTLEAELEQARGHGTRAIELSAQARAMAPGQDPQRVLTGELREARAGQGWERGEAGQLATLLAPAEGLRLSTGGGSALPFLPVAADGPAGRNAGAQTPVLAGYDEPSR